MRFSDIHMIMIGEEGEYGRRLVRYLETHLSTAIRVYHFTTTESFLAFKERADIYLLDEAFFQRLSKEKQNVLLREKRLILLTAQEEEGTFCKYHNPKKLLDRLSRVSDEMEDLASREDRREEERVEGREEGRETARTRLTMIYSPVYEEKLKEIARSFMKEGDVYIGAEDLGYKENISAYGQGSDMGDLCYYIQKQNLRDDSGELIGVGTHIWRHCYGKRLTEMHVDDVTIAKLLGHANTSNLKHYRKVGDALLANETRQMRNFMDEILTDVIHEWEGDRNIIK